MKNYTKRKTDRPIIYYKCVKCGRINPSFDTLMKNNQGECLWKCLPFINNINSWILN